MRGALGCVVLGAGVLVGCAGHYVRRGMDLYGEGRYVEAAELFERTQERVVGSTPDQQAEYGLYRGANFLSLGDCEHAELWLSYAYAVERAHPGALRREEQGFLEKSWIALGDRLRQAQRRVPASAVASTSPPGTLEAGGFLGSGPAEPLTPAR